MQVVGVRGSHRPSTIKIRKAGFTDCCDSHESLNLTRLREHRYIP